MARHKVQCVTMAPPANARDVPHPAGLGTEDGRRWNAADVVAALDAGEEFFTRRAATRADAALFAYDCRVCGVRTVRCSPTEDHNRLERHPACR